MGEFGILNNYPRLIRLSSKHEYFLRITEDRVGGIADENDRCVKYLVNRYNSTRKLVIRHLCNTFTTNQEKKRVLSNEFKVELSP